MLVLVPIPPDSLAGSAHVWMPFVEAIARRAKNDPAEMVRMLMAGEAQAVIVWEPEAKRAQAFMGVRFVSRGAERIAELIWLMGEDRKAWVHLLADLETYLRTEQNCVAVKPICRPGWSKFLKPLGYRLTHVTMEKEL